MKVNREDRRAPSTGLAEAETKPTVPAVERAIGVLRHLRTQADPRARTVTRIAEALGIHKSSCSNLLWTLEAAGFVEYSADSRAFQLGAELIGLGASAAKDRAFVRAAARPMEALVQATGITCVAFEQIASDEFIIVSKVDSPREIKVTIDVGQHFHPAAPALAPLVVAYKDAEAGAAYLQRWQNRIFTPATRSDPADLAAKVDFVRTHGFTVSRGEYYAGNTAIAAAVFSGGDSIVRGLCLATFTEEVADLSLEGLGQSLRRTADAISQVLGGAAPGVGEAPW
jgi:DNA-binding IclR family transcriptional regulator